MKTILISEYSGISIKDTGIFNLSETRISHCTGCWSCWWKTPGICIHKDLDDFYSSYVNADKVIFYAKLHEGFISSKMKSLFDRMIPLFLPYTYFSNGGTYHTPRYPGYPNVEFYYDYDFVNEEDYKLFYDYVYKVFEQFHSQEIKIAHISDASKEGVL